MIPLPVIASAAGGRSFYDNIHRMKGFFLSMKYLANHKKSLKWVKMESSKGVGRRRLWIRFFTSPRGRQWPNSPLPDPQHPCPKRFYARRGHVSHIGVHA
jgi:hypothetical protein